jgi:hypothetical protein
VLVVELFLTDVISPLEQTESQSSTTTPSTPPAANFPQYQQSILCFLHSNKKHVKSHHKFALQTISYHYDNMNQQQQDTKSKQPTLSISTWFDLIMLYTNAFVYSLNTQFIIADEILHVRRRYELELTIAKATQQREEPIQQPTPPQQQQQQGNKGKGGKQQQQQPKNKQQ